MSQALARKYRPKNFNELVGQTHVSRALTSALTHHRLHHAYLFTGTRGVGKTTIARILSKCLNCETGMTAMPCGRCSTCQAIDAGRYMDLIEIDAASRTKVEDTRELLDNVPYAPTQGRYKVYLIDEVHMLSTHSFNALLKTLEEPPEHVKFLLATTDPQKLPVTVLSRCLQFSLRPLPRKDIFKHLGDILQQEHIDVENNALWLIAESAQGSLRDALSLTDQAIAYGEGKIITQDVQNMLGLLDKTQLSRLLWAIHQSERDHVSQLLFDIGQQSLDLKSVMDQLVTLLYHIAVLQILPHTDFGALPEEHARLHELAQHISPSDLQVYYQISLQARAELSIAVTPQQGFDMCILRLLAFNAFDTQQGLTSNEAAKTQAPEPLHLKANAQPENIKSESDSKPELLNSEENSEPETINSEADFKPEYNRSEHHLQSEHINTEANSENSHSDNNHQVQPVDSEPEGINSDHDSQMEAISSDHHFHSHLQPGTLNSEANAQSETLDDGYSSFELLDVLDPRELLAHSKVDMTGEWTPEKWEQWVRDYELSMPVRALAQHGLMYGTIDGIQVFKIDYEYRLMGEQLFADLIVALQQTWPHSEITLEYEPKHADVPEMRKESRFKKAHQHAHYLIRQDKHIQAVVTSLEAQIVDVELIYSTPQK